MKAIFSIIFILSTLSLTLADEAGKKLMREYLSEFKPAEIENQLKMLRQKTNSADKLVAAENGFYGYLLQDMIKHGYVKVNNRGDWTRKDWLLLLKNKDKADLQGLEDKFWKQGNNQQTTPWDIKIYAMLGWVLRSMKEHSQVTYATLTRQAPRTLKMFKDLTEKPRGYPLPYIVKKSKEMAQKTDDSLKRVRYQMTGWIMQGLMNLGTIDNKA